MKVVAAITVTTQHNTTQHPNTTRHNTDMDLLVGVGDDVEQTPPRRTSERLHTRQTAKFPTHPLGDPLANVATHRVSSGIECRKGVVRVVRSVPPTAAHE